jgi:hypothetical protein
LKGSRAVMGRILDPPGEHLYDFGLAGFLPSFL